MLQPASALSFVLLCCFFFFFGFRSYNSTCFLFLSWAGRHLAFDFRLRCFSPRFRGFSHRPLPSFTGFFFAPCVLPALLGRFRGSLRSRANPNGDSTVAVVAVVVVVVVVVALGFEK